MKAGKANYFEATLKLHLAELQATHSLNYQLQLSYCFGKFAS